MSMFNNRSFVFVKEKLNFFNLNPIGHANIGLVINLVEIIDRDYLKEFKWFKEWRTYYKLQPLELNGKLENMIANELEMIELLEGGFVNEILEEPELREGNRLDRIE